MTGSVNVKKIRERIVGIRALRGAPSLAMPVFSHQPHKHLDMYKEKYMNALSLLLVNRDPSL
jgi:hypothetical protein